MNRQLQIGRHARPSRSPACPSAISSPAPTPTMPTPRMRSVSGSMMSFVRPSGRSSVVARPEAAQGYFATSIGRFCFFASVSVRPVHASSGSVKTHGGNRPRLEHRRTSVNRFDRHARLVRRLVRQHRIADDVADGEDRRLGGAALPVDLDEAALVHLHLRLVEPGDRGVRPAADGHEHAIEDLRPFGAFFPSKRHARAPSSRPSRR